MQRHATSLYWTFGRMYAATHDAPGPRGTPPALDLAGSASNSSRVERGSFIGSREEDGNYSLQRGLSGRSAAGRYLRSCGNDRREPRRVTLHQFVGHSAAQSTYISLTGPLRPESANGRPRCADRHHRVCAAGGRPLGRERRTDRSTRRRRGCGCPRPQHRPSPASGRPGLERFRFQSRGYQPRMSTPAPLGFR